MALQLGPWQGGASLRHWQRSAANRWECKLLEINAKCKYNDNIFYFNIILNKRHFEAKYRG